MYSLCVLVLGFTHVSHTMRPTTAATMITATMAMAAITPGWRSSSSSSDVGWNNHNYAIKNKPNNYTVESRYLEHAYLDFLVISIFSWCPNFFPFVFYINLLRLSRILISRLFRYLEVIFCPKHLYLYRIRSVYLEVNIAAMFGFEVRIFHIYHARNYTAAALDYRVIMFIDHYACVKCCASLTVFCLEVRIFNFYRPCLPCRCLRLFGSKVNWPLCMRSMPHVINTWVRGVIEYASCIYYMKLRLRV